MYGDYSQSFEFWFKDPIITFAYGIFSKEAHMFLILGKIMEILIASLTMLLGMIMQAMILISLFLMKQDYYMRRPIF